MKNKRGFGLSGALWAMSAILAGSIASGAAAAETASAESGQQRLAQDAKCTVCHNEAWRKPVLSIYQTKHGNRADARAPVCTSCHGSASSPCRASVGCS